MSAESALRHPGLLAAALARAEAWLLEPAPPRVEPGSVELPTRPVVAVIGLCPRCGATTVARALAARLAAVDPCGAAVVVGSGAPSGFAPPSGPASRLARRLEGSFATAGRLCLSESCDLMALAGATRRLAPLVLDVSRSEAPSGSASLADVVVLVAEAGGEPSLAELAAASLPRAVTVANRVRDRARWAGRPALLLPDSLPGARLALAGWEPRGPLRAAIGELASLCEAVAQR
jgi:hypothetical protein